MVANRNDMGRLNQSGITVVPKDPSAMSREIPSVNLYFIGWKTLRPLMSAPEPVYDDPKKKVPKLNKAGKPVYERHIEGWDTPTVIVMQRPYKMPEIGDYITVNNNVAEQIEKRLRVAENNRYYPGVTSDPTLAAAVKRAFEAAENDPRGMDSRLDLTSYSAVVDMDAMSTEQLEAELARRKQQQESTEALLKDE